jgi:LPXTG-motif cell wall-anchored protein
MAGGLLDMSSTTQITDSSQRQVYAPLVIGYGNSLVNNFADMYNSAQTKSDNGLTASLDAAASVGVGVGGGSGSGGQVDKQGGSTVTQSEGVEPSLVSSLFKNKQLMIGAGAVVIAGGTFFLYKRRKK